MDVDGTETESCARTLRSTVRRVVFQWCIISHRVDASVVFHILNANTDLLLNIFVWLMRILIVHIDPLFTSCMQCKAVYALIRSNWPEIFCIFAFSSYRLERTRTKL